MRQYPEYIVLRTTSEGGGQGWTERLFQHHHGAVYEPLGTYRLSALVQRANDAVEAEEAHLRQLARERAKRERDRKKGARS